MFAGKNKVETKIVRFFWNDGLLDVLAGAGVFLMGLAWQCDLVPLGAIAPAMLIPFWKPLRARITEPRLGFVELSEVQQRRNKTFLVVSILAGVLTLGAGVAAYFAVVAGGIHAVLSPMMPALPAFIFALMALMTGAVTSLNRFALYAVVFAVCGAAVALFQQRPGWALIAGGVAIMLGGGISLYRFVTTYTLPSETNGVCR